MNQMNTWIEKYLAYCVIEKNVDPKTAKAYGIDLKKFSQFLLTENRNIGLESLQAYINQLHSTHKVSTVKRKIASLRGFFSYLEAENLFNPNPFSQMHIRLYELPPIPKIVPLETMNALLQCAYQGKSRSRYPKQYRAALRDIAVLELIFATGLRVSELCALRAEAVNAAEGTITVCGTGVRLRSLKIQNPDARAAVAAYFEAFSDQIAETGWFLINRMGNQLSEQSVQRIINKYATCAGISQHITPRLLRNSFAVMLLEENVDIRNVQQLLGHSDIASTQVYSRIATGKPQDIPAAKYPRNKISIE